MATVESSDVRAIAEFEKIDNSDLEGFIGDSDTYVTNTIGDSVEQKTQTMITKWVAAHLASMKQKRIKSEGFTDADMEYEGETGMLLRYTRYGQQAILFDPTDTLGKDPQNNNTEEDSSGGGRRRYSTATHSKPENQETIKEPGYPVEKKKQ